MQSLFWKIRQRRLHFVLATALCSLRNLDFLSCTDKSLSRQCFGNILLTSFKFSSHLCLRNIVLMVHHGFKTLNILFVIIATCLRLQTALLCPDLLVFCKQPSRPLYTKHNEHAIGQNTKQQQLQTIKFEHYIDLFGNLKLMMNSKIRNLLYIIVQL